MGSGGPPAYRFGRFVLDLQGGMLLAGDAECALRAKSFALLRLFVENAGRLIDRDEIMQAIWPDVFVTDDSIAQCVSDIRRALGGSDQQFLRTVPRRGYRFAAPVVVVEFEKNAIAPPPQADATRPAAPQSGHAAEHRQITAMSCGLIGLSEPADGGDLETLREAVVSLQQCISEIAARHRGFIVNRQGNTLLILFGYPVAHEHNGEEAVRAALELCGAVNAPRLGGDGPPGCRIGLATSMVIIGNPVGDGGLAPQEIVGNAPILAARLQRSAQPNTVAIDAVTRRLIGNLFDCRDLGTMEATGTGGPMRCWQVVGAGIGESRYEALRGPAMSPLIGREEETDLLFRRWRRAQMGDGQAVLILGEPGIGKSRIAAELEGRLGTEPHVRLRYFCSPYHQDSALYPFADQFGRAAGFAPHDPPTARLEKLEALLAHAAAPAEDVGFIADLLSLQIPERHPFPNLSPQRKKERTLDALIRQLEGLTRQQPVLMVFEDAHWIDPTSRELLDLTIERIRNLPVLLIVTSRPEFRPDWSGQPQLTMLTLNRLERRDCSALVLQIAGGTLSNEVVDQLVERTDGVPLFIEELTKSVLERAAGLAAIPTTLHDSLMARIDRLGSVRLVAQIGAAMGRQFRYALLRAVSDFPENELRAALAGLVASELVFQRGTPPEAVYTFKHALVQDAAHGSLLRDTRQRLHRQIAEALRAHFPELTDTQPELLARHYAEAGIAEKSAFFWGKAGARSLARSAMSEAAAQLQEGLDQLARLPGTVERLRQELEFLVALGTALRAVKGFAAPETGRAWSRARKLWEEQGSPQEFINIPFALAAYHGLRLERDLALSLIDQVLRLSHQRNDASGLILGYSEIGETLMFAGELASSRSHLERALAVRGPGFQPASFTHDPLVPARGNLAIVLFCLGYPDRAWAASRATIAEAQRLLGHPASLTLSRIFDAILLSLVGDNASLDAQAGELIAAATEHGFALYRAQGTIFGGWAKVKNGEIPEGNHLLRSGLDAYRATGSEVWMPHYRALQAMALEIAGQTEEAAVLLDDALHTVERTGERWFEAELNRYRAELLLRQGDAEAAEELFRKAMRIAQEQQAKLWELRAAVSLARLHRDRGCPGDARGILAPVYSWFTEGFDTPDLKQAKALLDELARTGGPSS